MKPFTFQTPPNILFEAGASKIWLSWSQYMGQSGSSSSLTRAYVTRG